MSRSTSQRAQPRVQYPADVRLHAASSRQVIRGRSLNLSASGILIESDAPFDVGTVVHCELPLPGGPRRLKGRVARMQPLPLSAAGMGIAIKFVDLGAEDEELLRQLVGGNGQRSRLVKVRFEGLREPLRSQAVLTEEGIRLSTALPFLRLSSEVGVSFLAGESRVESRGVVRDVQIEPRSADGIPRLAVDVHLSGKSEPAPVPVSPVPKVVREAASESSRRDDRRNGRSSAVVAEPAAHPPRPSKRRKLKQRGQRPGFAPTPRPETAPTGNEPRRRGIGRAALVIVPVTAALGALVAWLGSLWLAAEPERPAIVAPPPPAPPPPAPVVQPAPAAPLPPLFQLPWRRAAAAPPRKAQTAFRPLPPETPGPEIQVEGDRATAVVPVVGSTGGMIHYSLDNPRGLAVNLPHAQSALPLGLHALRRDGFRFVWIRPRQEGGIQVRFIFTHPAPDERILDVEGEAVKVRVKLPE